MSLIPFSLLDKFQSNMTAIFIWLIRILSVVGIAAFCIVIYGAYFEKPLLNYQNLPFPVEGDVEQGRTVPILVERCNLTKDELIYMATRSLRNVDTNKTVMLPNDSVSLKPGCHRATNRSVLIPQETPPGAYVLEGQVIIRGLIKQHKLDWYTETFNVIPQTVVTQKLSQENATDRLHTEIVNRQKARK